MLQPIIFFVVCVLGFGFAGYKFSKLRRNVLLGKDDPIESDPAQRFKNMMLVAFGQKKMFKRWIPAVLHGAIYVAFLFTQIELVEILVDGFTNGHRTFAPVLGGIYTLILNFIEVLSVLALIATFIFLWRRSMLSIPRFNKPEMEGWPHKDANIILYLEIVLVFAILTMNGTDTVLQGLDPGHYPDTGTLAVSSWFGPLVFGGLEQSTLVILERVGWWLHFLVVIAFLNYLPISKHLHIVFAFPMTYFARLKPKAEMENMPAIQKEVQSMMDPNAAFDEADMSEELPEFGSKDVTDLSWIDVLGGYACTQCGRCTDSCPANLTGKKLSPRKVMMDIRTRAEEIGTKLDSGDKQYIAEDKREDAKALTKDNFDDGKSLFDYISREEIHACTTCQACVEACPININPMEPILKLRRYEILTESAGPTDWLPMFTAIENGGAVWAMSEDRDKWAQDASDV
ncbi:MAG: 4Fe-4S dicluster domain-containing protein [Saprospiraceae bacterium]